MLRVDEELNAESTIATMKSTPVRKAENDILLAPGNAALILIDYQPPQVSWRRSRWRRPLPR
jgi:hypothetical protein